MLTAAAISAAFTGVAVSPRAKKVATVLRISTKGNKPDRIGGKRVSGGKRIGIGECAARKQRPHQQIGNDDEGGKARHRQQQREFDRAVLRMRGARFIAGGNASRHFRQDHGAGGNANDADRQLVEPVGIIERRQRAGGEEACDDRVGKQRKLHAHGTDGGGAQRAEKPAHVGVEFGPAQHRQRAGAPGSRRRPAAPATRRRSARPRPRLGRRSEKGGQRQRHHHRQIEQGGGGGGRGEPLQRIEDAAVERHQRDQQQIGKSDAGQIDGKREALGIALKTRRQQIDRRPA